jgi:hypothetical protein
MKLPDVFTLSPLNMLRMLWVRTLSSVSTAKTVCRYSSRTPACLGTSIRQEKDSVDAAVIPFASSRLRDYDISPIPVQIFVDEARIGEFNIGLGDEIFSVGLFTRYFGRSTLIPIVRTGNIAMMPREPVPLGPFGLTEV